LPQRDYDRRMGMSKQQQMAMTATEKRRRNAEAAAVRHFVHKPKVEPTTKSVVKTAKINRSTDFGVVAATNVQSAWRRVVAKRVAAALKKAMATSRMAAADAASYQRVLLQLRGSLEQLRCGQRLGAAAIVRGDMKKLHVLYGPAVATMTRAMRALVRKRAAEKVVAVRRRELEVVKAAAKAAAEAEMAELAAKRAAVGAALKAAAQKERAAALEMLSVHAALKPSS
jgi:hypothetical protein